MTEGGQNGRRRLFEVPATMLPDSRRRDARSSRGSADGHRPLPWDEIDTFVVRESSSTAQGKSALPDLWDGSGNLLGKLEHTRRPGTPRWRVTSLGLKLRFKPSQDDVRLSVVLFGRSSGAPELTLQRVSRASGVEIQVTSHIPGRDSGAVATREARLEIRSSYGDVLAEGRTVGLLSWEVTPSPAPSSTSSPPLVAAMIEGHPGWLPGLGGGRGWTVTITPSGRALTHLVVAYALMTPLLVTR